MLRLPKVAGEGARHSARGGRGPLEQNRQGLGCAPPGPGRREKEWLRRAGLGIRWPRQGQLEHEPIRQS
jgi:hypothetical protein